MEEVVLQQYKIMKKIIIHLFVVEEKKLQEKAKIKARVLAEYLSF
jgi:hypothetical protein